MVKYGGRELKRPWPILKCYHYVSLSDLRKIRKFGTE